MPSDQNESRTSAGSLARICAAVAEPRSDRRLHHVARLSQLVSRAKRKTEEIDFLFIVASVVVPDAVTLPADLRRPRWKEVPWFHDRRIVISADMAKIAAQRVTIDANVLAGRPMTRFARDPKLRGRRFGGSRLAQVRRNRRRRTAICRGSRDS